MHKSSSDIRCPILTFMYKHGHSGHDGDDDGDADSDQ